VINFIHEHSPMHHQVLSIQPITHAISSIHATQNSFVLKISPKSLNILMWSHSSMHTELHFLKITKSSTNRIFIYSVFIVNIYSKFCFIYVVKFDLFENYSLFWHPSFSLIFFSPLSPTSPVSLLSRDLVTNFH